jgi:hypothetical protein
MVYIHDTLTNMTTCRGLREFKMSKVNYSNIFHSYLLSKFSPVNVICVYVALDSLKEKHSRRGF